jgi:hypothetical protein
MKTISQDEVMTQNLVMFPSAKNFKVDLERIDHRHDPLQDLLYEYSHVLETDIPTYLDERFEEQAGEDDAFDSLEAFMNRHQRGEVLTPDDKLIKIINERLDAIKEAKERIKFYLEEIEMFLPAKRK